MGNAIRLLLTLLLGWLDSLARWLWTLFSSDDAARMLGWLEENWVRLAIIVLIAGTIVDLLVHLLRWRPLTVYASFFRRIGSRFRKQEAPQEDRAEYIEKRSIQIDAVPGENLLQRVRRAVTEDPGDGLIHYEPAPLAVEEHEAYRRPVMPERPAPAAPVTPAAETVVADSTRILTGGQHPDETVVAAAPGTAPRRRRRRTEVEP